VVTGPIGGANGDIVLSFLHTLAADDEIPLNWKLVLYKLLGLLLIATITPLLEAKASTKKLIGG